MGMEVTGIKQLAQKLDKLANTTGKKAEKALRVYGFQLLSQAQLRSPVDTGRFRGTWTVRPLHLPDSIAAIEISNPMPYGPILEHGSTKGKKPWPSAGPATKEIDGVIRSKQAPEGILSPLLETIKEEAALAVYKGVMK